MSRETVLAAGRAFLTAALVDTCVIERSGTPFTNLDTGQVTTPYTPVYTGPCEVKQESGSAGQTTIAEAALRLGLLVLKLPIVGTEGLLTGDRVTITAARHDAELVGRVFWLTGQAHASHKTARKISMSEVLS